MEARSGPNQGFARPPFTGLRVVATSNVGSTDSDDASKRGACRAQVGASAKREHAAEARKPAEKRAAGHNSFVLQQMSDDHTEPSGTLPAIGPAPCKFPES